MQKVLITSPGIKKALRRYNYKQAIVEYVWNGFDAEASSINLDFVSNEIGNIKELTISDNGYGIPNDLLQSKFTPFFESEKALDPSIQRNSSAIHGKNGVGRLTFFHFAQSATWTTVFESEGRRFKYNIMIDQANLDTFSATVPVETKDSTGTSVTFEGIFEFTAYNFETDILEHLRREFGWYLELHVENNFTIKLNGNSLDYDQIIGDKETFNHRINDIHFEIRYIRWEQNLNKEYSRYYYLNSHNIEIGKETTTLNNKSDHFYHSVFIKSKYFDDFVLKEANNQPTLFGGMKSDQLFKELIEVVDQFLRSKRKPFLRYFSEQVISDFEEDNAFPVFGNNVWDIHRKQELENLVRELAQVEPRIFSRLNVEQKRTFAHLLNLIIDSGEQGRLFDILNEIISLDPDERQELAMLLKSSRLSSIVKTIKLIEDRYRAVNRIRDLVFKKSLGANERDHLQKAIEKHYWLFGEQYHLVTAEEPKFEEALRRYVYILQGVDEKQHIDHPDKYKEMDIFMIRQNMQNDSIRHIVIELKHPRIGLGEKEVSQVKKYFRVILSQDEFNGSNRFWEFYLVGNKFNKSGFIESELRNARHHGEKSLIFSDERYKIYVKTWDEIFADFEMKHKFLNEKLRLEREWLINEEQDANQIISDLSLNSARRPSQVTIPNS